MYSDVESREGAVASSVKESGSDGEDAIGDAEGVSSALLAGQPFALRTVGRPSMLAGTLTTASTAVTRGEGRGGQRVGWRSAGIAHLQQ